MAVYLYASDGRPSGIALTSYSASRHYHFDTDTKINELENDHKQQLQQYNECKMELD